MRWIDRLLGNQTFSPEAWKAFTDKVVETAKTRYTDELALPIADGLIRQTLGEVSYGGDKVRESIPVRNIMSATERGQHMYPLRGNPESFTLAQLDEFIEKAPEDFMKSIVMQELLREQRDKAGQLFYCEERIQQLEWLDEILVGKSARTMFANLLEQGRRALLEKQREIDTRAVLPPR